MSTFTETKALVEQLKTQLVTSLTAIQADVQRLANRPNPPTPEEFAALNSELQAAIDVLKETETSVDATADAAAGQDEQQPA